MLLTAFWNPKVLHSHEVTISSPTSHWSPAPRHTSRSHRTPPRAPPHAPPQVLSLVSLSPHPWKIPAESSHNIRNEHKRISGQREGSFGGGACKVADLNLLPDPHGRRREPTTTNVRRRAHACCDVTTCTASHPQKKVTNTSAGFSVTRCWLVTWGFHPCFPLFVFETRTFCVTKASLELTL